MTHPFKSVASALLFFSCAFGFNVSTANAQAIDNVPQSTPGTLINGPIDPDVGRLTTLEYLGGYIIAIPEVPGSEETDHLTVKAWDLSNMNNPVAVQPINPDAERGHFGLTAGPFLSHGTIKRDNEVFIGGWPNDAVRLNDNGTLEHVEWSGQDLPLLIDRNGNQLGEVAPWWSKSGLMRPWAMFDSWEYNSNSPDNTRLTLGNRVMAEWNIAQDSGVTGFGNFIGNLLVYSSDQRNTGVAVYDATDIRFDSATGEWKPRLLDTLNTPIEEGSIGGYWSAISGHYIVFARRSRHEVNENFFAGIQVVDFSDPTDLRLHCSIELTDPNNQYHWTLGPSPMYLGFQDEYAYTDNYKINIETCEVELTLDVTQGQTGDLCYFGDSCPKRVIDTSQYSRIIGNLWFAGGYPLVPDIDGMSVWVHQSEPDTRAPYIAYHIPRPNQTNYPINAPLSFSIPETLRSQTVVVTATADPGETETVTLTEVDGDKVNIDYVIAHTGMLTVEPLEDLKPDTSYEVAFTSGILDAAGNAMQPYSFRFSTGSTVVIIEGPEITQVGVSPSRTAEVNDAITVSIQAPGATEYQLALDGETPVWQASATRVFNFSEAGEYFINLRARNVNGDSALVRERIVIENPANASMPGNHSSQLVCDIDGDSVVVVNPDNNSLTKLNASSLNKDWEVLGPNKPTSVAKSNQNEYWVTANNEDRIYVYDQSGALLDTIDTGYGSGPSHIVASPFGAELYVSMYNSGRVVRYSANRDAGIAPQSLSAGPTPQAMAVSPDGQKLLVTRFISDDNWAEVYEINVSNWSLTRTHRLYKHIVDDQLDEGRGLPNYLAGIIINGDGTRAFVSAKKDNVDRGLLNGIDLDLDDDNTVRTMLMVLDLENNEELRAQRRDFDNADSPSGLAISDGGQYLFVALQGKNSIAVLGLDDESSFTGSQSLIISGLATQGLCFDGERNKLFAKNYTERSVTSLDLDTGVVSPTKTVVTTVANETFSDEELAGLQIFYNAFNGLQQANPEGKMSVEGYISCATCHIDGGHDGRTWDFTGRGEGIRNNISLKGRGGTRFGNVHWSANFDEIHDFEHDIRNAFGGVGLMSDSEFATANTPLGTPKAGLSQDLDNLAAYVARLGKETLSRSPTRSASGSMVAAARAGSSLFKTQGCNACHSGSALTDGEAHDVGTLRVHSGQRLGAELPGIKTPSLLGLFDTAPYLHDGSATTINDVFNTVGGTVLQAEDAIINSASVVSQVGYSYLRGASAVRFDSSGAGSVRFNNVGGGSGGAGKLRLRYGSSDGTSSESGGEFLISVNGSTPQRLSLARLPLVEGNDTNVSETSSITINLNAGNNNQVTVEYDGNSTLLDEITVSHVDDVAKANAHLRVASLSLTQQNQLTSYLASLDQASAPSDTATDIFENPPEDDEWCFPIITKKGTAAVICL